jgi:hypothetical protein
MNGSIRVVVLVAVLLPVCATTLTGCKNSNFCEGNPHDDCRLMWDASEAIACTSNAQCAAPRAVCEVTSGACVECIAPSEVEACSGVTPVCGADHACRGCEAHGECASGACGPDGACADASQVAYVARTGSGNACTQASPCPLLKDALAKNLPFIKIAASGAANDTATVVIDGKVVTILAEPGATLDRDGNGPALEVRSANADVVIYDLHVTGATGITDGHGILMTPNGGQPKLTLVRVTVDNNQGAGISATGSTLTVSQSTVSANSAGGISATGGTLTVSQSTVATNNGVGISATGGTLTVSQSTVLTNNGGGIAIVAAQFDVTNTIVASNGSPSSVFGGVRVDQSNTGVRRFDFNTVTNNVAAASSTTGVVCTLVTQPVTFSNNIVYANQVGGDRTQVGGSNCNWTYSDIGPDTVAGTGNINVDPLFVNLAQNDFHLTASSPAKDVADPAATQALDFDGDTRPQGSGRDMGADEYKP